MKESIKTITFDDIEASGLPNSLLNVEGEWRIIGGRLHIDPVMDIEDTEPDVQVQIELEEMNALYSDLFPETDPELPENRQTFTKEFLEHEVHPKLRTAFINSNNFDRTELVSDNDGRLQHVSNEKEYEFQAGRGFVQTGIEKLERHADKFTDLKWMEISRYQNFTSKDFQFLIDFKHEVNWDAFFMSEVASLGLEEFKKLEDEGIQINWKIVCMKSDLSNWSEDDFEYIQDKISWNHLFKNPNTTYVSLSEWNKYYAKHYIGLSVIDLVESVKLPYINTLQDLSLIGYNVTLCKTAKFTSELFPSNLKNILKEVYIEDGDVYIEEIRSDSPVISLYKVSKLN